MRTWILVVALALMTTAGSGCVPKADYVKLQNQYNKLEKENARNEERIKAQLSALKELLAELKPLIDRGVLEVEVVEGRIVIGMASDVLFASGSAALSDNGKRNVAELARLLARRVDDRNFQVEGHTDNEPINTPEFPDNWSLGAERSLAVARYMISNGFPRDHLSAATFADTMPVADNDNGSGRTKNRRIEIVLLPDLGDLPGYKKLTETQPGRARGKKRVKR